MERVKFLELCRQNAVEPGSVRVLYQGTGYYPSSYCLWFDQSGEVKHSAILLSTRSRSELRCSLDDVDSDDS